MNTPIFNGGIVLIGLFLLSFSSTAQVTRTDGFVDVNQGQPNSIVQEIPYQPDGYKGTEYLRPHWAEAKIELYSGDSIVNYPIKYNVESHQIELQTDKGIKLLDASDVARFEWQDSLNGFPTVFVNTREYDFDDGYVSGMFEVILDGDHMKLFSHKEIQIRDGNYNVQIDIGDRKPQLYQRESFFLLEKEKLVKLKGGKNQIIPHFKDKKGIIQRYAKSNKLSFKKRADLILIVGHYNNLIE